MIVQTADSQIYMVVQGTRDTKPATLPTRSAIAATANRVDDKGLDQFALNLLSERRVRGGNDSGNTGNVYRDPIKQFDFNVSFRVEYRDEAGNLAEGLFKHGLCANYFASFVFRQRGAGTGKPEYYGHAWLADPVPSEDGRGIVWTILMEGEGYVSVHTQ